MSQLDQVGGEIMFSAPEEDPQKTKEAVARLRHLRQQIDENDSSLRRSSQGIADLRYPEPNDAPTASSNLDPGTLMLSYSIGQR